jgi:hypothetical protein
MRPRTRSGTAHVALKTIVIVVLSITSLVLARALIGIEVTVDGVPVAKGEVVGTELELSTLPTWPADGDLRLYFDDGTREDAFARLGDGEVVVTTVEFGTETLVDYLWRLGIDGALVPIESSCELMDVAHPMFGVFCAAYDPALRPPEHPDVTGLTCSTCHDAAELEAAYRRARDVVPTSATPPAGHREIGPMACSTCHAGTPGDAAAGTPVLTVPPGHRPIGSATCSSCHGTGGDAGGTPVVAPPPGHRPIGSATCSSCHGGTPGDAGGTPVVTLPRDHRPIGSATCSSCHGTGGFDDDVDEDHDDEHDDEDDEHDDEEDDEHDDEDDD